MRELWEGDSSSTLTAIVNKLHVKGHDCKTMTTINLTEGRAQTKTSVWRTTMLSLFGRWITTTINIFVRSQHSSFHYSTSQSLLPFEGPNVAASYYILDGRITFWYGRIFLPSYLVISFVSYTKIFRALSHRQVQVQDHVLQQPSQPSALNTARYNKAVYMCHMA